MKVLFNALILAMILQQLLAVVCPADKPYTYNGVCYAQCPWVPPDVTYLNTLDNTCVLNCPGPLYFADDATKTCTQTCPSYPIMTYYDHSRQKCVQKCSSNPSEFSYATNRSCLAQCPDPLYADDSTRDCVASCPTGMYYQIVGTLRICTAKCYPNYYANESKICVSATNCPSTPVKFYGDDLSGLCVKSCPQNADTYAQESTRKCVHHCTLGTFADPTTLRCVSKCPSSPLYYGSNTTRMCHLMCVQGQFAYEVDRQCYKVCPVGFGDYSTRKCVLTCPSSNKTFADPQTKLCIEVCSPGYYADNDTRSCVSSIDCTGNLVGDPLTLQCIDGQKCPVGYFIDYTLFLCVKRCTSGQFANLDTRVCNTDCPWNPLINITFKQSDTRRCVLQCPSDPRTFSDNVTQSCVTKCPDGTFGTPTNYDCVETCPDGFYGDSDTNLCMSTCTTNTSVILYFYAPNTSCLTACPEYSYADNTTLTCVKVCPPDSFANQDTNQCVKQCPDTTFGDKHSKKCVSKCPAITKQYADDSTNLCVDKCPLDPDYFGEDLNDGNRKCVSQCTLTDVYADPITRTCTKQCNFAEGYFGYKTTRRCVLKCPVGYGNPVTKLCTSACPESPIQTYGDNLTSTCVFKCPNNTYGDKTLQMCVNATDCPSGQYGDDSTNTCVKKCPFLLNTFGDPVTKKCVKACQYSYYADNTTRLCTQTCNTTAQLYKDPSTRKCVLDCPSKPDLYNDPANKQCVPNCTSSTYPYKYHYQTIRKCVAMCPSSPAYFADEQTKTCVLKCANLTFKFTNNTYRGCLSYCPLQILNATQNITLYEDNTTWTCVSVCPLGYYAFAHPTDTTIRKCVKMCQIIAGVYYFADDVTRSCVTECPTKVHNTWGDRITFKCVKTCSRKQYRDITTKQCTYSCPDSPVEYFADNSTWNCTKKCPKGTYAESTNNTCVKQCPTNYFGYQQKCLSQCPAGTSVFQDNTTWFCVDKCSSLPDYYSDSQNQKCVKNCTAGTFADKETRHCVAAVNCSGDTVADPLTYRCIDQCSKVPMYFVMPATNLCGSVCTDGLFAYNDTNTCVENCPAPYFGVNTSANFYCIQYCPSGQYKYIDEETGLRICLVDCPEGYFGFDPKKECTKICPNGYFGNQADNLCITDCTPLYADDSTNMCVDTCPTPTTADNNTYTCKGKCVYGEFMEENVCVTTCSDGYFADNLTRSCLDKCPSDPFTFADPFVKKCVFQCSPNYYGFFDNRTCEQTCPAGLFTQLTLRICINPCLEGQFGDPDTQNCVTGCSLSSYPYADPSSQECVKLCPETPDLYGSTNKCLDQCPLGYFAQNFTRICVDICPNVSSVYKNVSFADDLTRRCVQRCSALSYAHTNITHNVCVNQCPSGFFASEILQACVVTCPPTTFAQNTSKQCVSRCPNGQWADTHTKTCMDGCYNGQFADNSTNMCVDKCPQNPDLYGQAATNSCVLSCKANFYAHPIERMCMPQCASPYYADPTSQLCVLQCPTHEMQYADDEIRKCVASCTNYTGKIYYADRTTKKCVASCPKLPQLLYGLNSTNTCEETCPSGTYGDNDTRLCLDFCIFADPKFTWMDRQDNMCVKQCPLGYFSDNTTKSCETFCSTGTWADNSTRKCVFNCPVSPASFATTNNLGKPVCVYTCASGLYSDEVTRTCVQKCPLEPFYYFHSNFTNSCEKQCLYPSFGEVQSQFCVAQCKESFYGNLTTKRCQPCRTQCVTCSAYLECLTCQIGFYLYEFECVTACPTYPILYFSLQASAKCFKKCPSPYFGLESTKKCQFGCPVSYYPNELTRICTPCPTGCLSCDAKGCISCYSGFTYVNITRTCNQYCNSTHIYYFKDSCYNACPDGSFLTKDLVHCDPCASECATCSLIAGNCTKCADKFYYQGLCVDACPPQYFVDDDMACIACKVNPQKCVVSPLTYNITPFTENYMQKAYVTFSRPVNMTLDEFVQVVQINFNGKALKASDFTAKVYNTTTYIVTISQSVSNNQNALKIQYKPIKAPVNKKEQQIPQQQPLKKVSLNQNTLTIGFKPGTIKDTTGNILTVNTLEHKFQQQTVVSQDVVVITHKVADATLVVTWIFLAFVFLFLLKSNYPVLLFIEVVQIIYMHIFLYAGPMPFLELNFLKSLKGLHFTFFPQLFSLQPAEKAYEDISTDMSFLANCHPLIFVWVIVGILFLLFTILSSKKIMKNKDIRKFAKRVKKYRMRFSLINDAFWITFIYAMFFAIYQLKKPTLGSSLNIGNFFFAMVVLVLYLIFTVYMIRLGSQFKGKKADEIPKKFSFIMPQASQFPMEIPLRYLRKLLLCMALVMPAFEAQIIIMLMINFVFMCYYLCFMPSASKMTNYLNFFIQTGYLVLEGLFYGYFKLDFKTAEEQAGFSITFITVEALIIFVVFLWVLYRFIELFKSSSTWKYIYMKLTENTDPEYLKQQQRKRDLEFDFGSLENQSNLEGEGIVSGQLDISSKNLNLKRLRHNSSAETKVFFDAEIEGKGKNTMKKLQKKSVQKAKKATTTQSELTVKSSSNISISQKSKQEQLNDKILNDNLKPLKPKQTRIISPLIGKRGTLLKIDNKQQNEVEELVLKNQDIRIVDDDDEKKKEKCIWDDIQFDENQI